MKLENLAKEISFILCWDDACMSLDYVLTERALVTGQNTDRVIATVCYSIEVGRCSL